MKTMIKTCFIAVAILLGVNANAQDKPLEFGVKAGVNLSNMTGDINNTDAKVGFNVGVTMDYALSPDVYLLTGLELTTKGFKYTSSLGKVTLNPMYLQLPVHVGYKLAVAEGTKVVFHAGPYVAYGIAGKATVKNDLGKEKENVFSTGGLKEFDFGLGIGAGLEFGKIGVGLGWDFGLVNVWDADNVKVKNMNGYLSLGYKF